MMNREQRVFTKARLRVFLIAKNRMSRMFKPSKGREGQAVLNLWKRIGMLFIRIQGMKIK